MDKSTTDNIYGDNAITGSIEDAAPEAINITVDGSTEDVAVTDTQKGGEENADKADEQKTADDVKDAADDTDEETGSTEEALNKEVEKHDKSVKEISDKLSAKGIDFEAVKAEFDKNLELSDDTYSSLEKAGYPKNAVDLIISGMQATAEKFVNAVHTHAGGKEKFEAIQSFVKAQGDKEVAAFNRVMQCKDIGQINMFVDGIKAQMSLKHGTNNNIILGGNTSSAGTDAFRSTGEIVAAMADRRYQTDSAYRADVQRRVIASNVI